MKITKEMLRTDTPPIIEQEDGGVNCVLAYHADNAYSRTNLYMSRWTVSNTVYYNKNRDQYLGWIELEKALVPKFD